MSGHDTECGSSRIGKLALQNIFVRFVVLMCIVLSRNKQILHQISFFEIIEKMCEKFDRKLAPWSASRRALSTSMRCWAAEAWVMVLKFPARQNLKRQKIVCWKNIYPESGGCNMGMKMLRKHISCERLGSEIALNLLSEHKLLVS